MKSLHGLTNAEKNIASLIREEIDGSAPVMATVVQVRGSQVRVKLPEDQVAGEAWFTSAITPVPTGSVGLVIPMRGNARYFLPLGVDLGDEGGLVDSVNGKIGNVTLDADDIDDTTTSHKFVTASDLANLENLSGVNTGDQDLSGLATKAELASKADDSTLLSALPADIGSNGQVLKVQSGGVSWEPDLNTTYSELTEAEITAGTASTLRTMSGRRAQAIVNKARTDLETTAQLDARDTANRDRGNHTGTQLASTISDFYMSVASHSIVAANAVSRHEHSNKSVLDDVTAAYTTAMNTKLSGIATEATKNQADAYLLNRGNHTGNQAIHTITNLQETLDGKPLVVDPGNRSTAIGVDAQAIGASSFAAGDTAIASGINSIAIGVDSDATGFGSAAIGQGAKSSGQSSAAVGLGADASGDNTTALGIFSTASDEGATAVGGSASASGFNSTAVGFLSEATGNGTSAMGVSAEAHGQSSNAIGSDARVPVTSPRSQAFGAGVVIPENTPDTTVIGAASLEVKPDPYATGNISTITLYDASGNPHVIPATVGQTHFGRAGASPAGENTTLVISNFTQGKSMWSSTLAALISETAIGLWNVKMTVSAVVYRSVATGGVYLFAGSAGTNSNALGRLSPQTHAYTLTRTIDFKNVSGTTVLDARYGGQGTVGTTHVVSYDVDVTAVRTG